MAKEYIDRQELIDAGRAIKLKDICPDWNVPIVAKALEQQGQAFLELIKKAPTEDVKKVKHGMWFGISDYGNGNCIGYCSSCGTTHKAENATAFKMFHKYCYWCGAKMDLKEGAEE